MGRRKQLSLAVSRGIKRWRKRRRSTIHEDHVDPRRAEDPALKVMMTNQATEYRPDPDDAEALSLPFATAQIGLPQEELDQILASFDPADESTLSDETCRSIATQVLMGFAGN